MAKTDARTTPQAAPTRADEPKTHLLARSRGARPFNRAGVRFEPDFKAILLADLKPGQVEAIMAEPMIEARIASHTEAERFAVVKAAGVDESVSRAELVEYILKLETKLNTALDRIRSLEVAATGDRPPRDINDLPPPNLQQ